MGYQKLKSMVVTNEASKRRLLGDFSLTGHPPRSVCNIWPKDVTNLTVDGTPGVEVAKWGSLMFIGMTGNMDWTIDWAVTESPNAGGPWTPIAGMTFAQLTSSDDNKAVIGFVTADMLSAGNAYVNCQVTGGNLGVNLATAVLVGLGWAGPLADYYGFDAQQRPAGILSGLTVKLYTNDSDVSPWSAAGDFTWAALSGGGTAVKMTGPLTLSGGRWMMTIEVTFVAGPTPTSETLYGWGLLWQGSLSAGGRLAEPQTIVAEGDFVSFKVKVPIESFYSVG